MARRARGRQHLPAPALGRHRALPRELARQIPARRRSGGDSPPRFAPGRRAQAHARRSAFFGSLPPWRRRTDISIHASARFPLMNIPLRKTLVAATKRLVSRLGFEPRTPALKGQCSTIELPARLSVTNGQRLRSLSGRRVLPATRESRGVYPYKITSLRPYS